MYTYYNRELFSGVHGIDINPTRLLLVYWHYNLLLVLAYDNIDLRLALFLVVVFEYSLHRGSVFGFVVLTHLMVSGPFLTLPVSPTMSPTGV